MTSVSPPLSKITRQFVSSNQTITSAGSLTIAHGLGVAPQIVEINLICLTAQNGYAVNDVINVNPAFNGNGAGNKGVSITYDATNIYLRFGSDATCFEFLNKTTGVAAAFTNANFAVRMRAFA